jgi:dihydrodipicolinate synthase/N-acetylneuraminate lyase
MQKEILDLAGAWSAAPTPFTESLAIDSASVRRMVKHHIRLKQKGVFIGGTCGEGPWLPRADMRKLTELVTAVNNGCMKIAVQVTDNSYSKVLEHIKNAKSDGADIAIVAEPWFTGPIRPECIEEYYLNIIDKSALPVGIYSRGAAFVPLSVCAKVLRHDNVCLFKDSSLNDDIMKLALSIAAKRRLCVLTGYELGMVKYLAAGYHGILAGGGILIGSLTAKMIEAARVHDIEQLNCLQAHCDRINYAAYGKKVKNWLTGLKYALVKMGIFSTTAGYLKYPLPKSVQNSIDKMIVREHKVLFP